MTTPNPQLPETSRADVELAAIASFTVHGPGAASTLRAGAAATSVDEQARRDLITAIRGGQHVELEIEAVVFRQKDGRPNGRGVRIATDQLERFASDFAGMPVLLDHDQEEQQSRIGTIVASSLASHGGTGWSSIVQRMRIVKPEAVISVLDGTIDRFSVGFGAGDGAVICSVHRTARFTSCRCWALDSIEVDGTPTTVEWEYTAPKPRETSAVNVPAVDGTAIRDVRQALAAGLDIRPGRDEPPPMPFPRLAAILLSTTALSEADEDRAVEAVRVMKAKLDASDGKIEILQARATTAEVALAAANVELATINATKLAAGIDLVIEDGYREGKLAVKRDEAGKRIAGPMETALRKLATKLGVEGVDAVRAQLSDMPEIVPVGQRSLAVKLDGIDPAKGADLEIVNGGLPSSVLASTAAQLGIDPKELAANAALLAGSRRNTISKER